MGGGGSDYPSKGLDIIKDTIQQRIPDKRQEAEGVGGGGGLTSSGFSFPITCEREGLSVDADVLNGYLVFIYEDTRQQVSFEEYEQKYSLTFGYDYCAAAIEVLKLDG